MFIVCADLHLSEKKPAYRKEENWMDLCLGKLYQVIEYARMRKSDIYIAGDLFDKSAHTPELVNLVMAMFDDFEFNIFIIPGNHDIKNHNLDLLEKSSIDTLGYLERVVVIWEPIQTLHSDCFPFGTEYKSGFTSKGSDIAIIHKFAYLNKPWAGAPASGSYKKIIRSMPGYKLIIAGDNHEPFIKKYKGCTFLNCGGLTRTSQVQIDHKPAFYVIGDDLSIETVYLEVKKNVFDNAAINLIKKKDEAIAEIVEQMKVDIRVNLDFKKNMRRYIDKNKIKEDVKNLITEAMENEH